MNQLNNIDLNTYKERLGYIRKNIVDKDKLIKEQSLLFELLIEQLTLNEYLSFTTLFSRVTFLRNVFNISSKQIFLLQTLRRGIDASESLYTHQELLILFDCAFDLLFECIKNPSSKSIIDLPDFIKSGRKDDSSYHTLIIGLIYIEDAEYIFVPENGAEKKYLLKLDQEDVHRLQLDRLFELGNHFIHANLLQVEVSSSSVHPKTIVLLPNYLIDVTSVANCFKSKGKLPQAYLIRKFFSAENSLPILIGNSANHMLDTLIYNKGISFNEIMVELFQQNPISFLKYDDDQIRSFSEESRKHFNHINHVLSNQLESLGIQINNTYTEPTFLSNIYGLQGRLDVLHQSNQNKQHNIIELKSGSAFSPNAYGITSSHYTQTLLYDLMIHSAYGTKANVSNYILYSKLPAEQLKYAPKAVNQQMAALTLRNDLVFIDQILQHLDEDKSYDIFLKILNGKSNAFDKFSTRDMLKIQEYVNSMSDLDQYYFRSFVAFIAREHALAKTGQHGINHRNGMASLWMDNLDEKIEQFTILSFLQIEINKAHEENPVIELKRSDKSNQLAKFRQGDIVVFYPWFEGIESPLKNQIFKCTILVIDDEKIVIRLRNRQFNQTIFEQFEYWSLEPDFLDSGYLQLYRNLLFWITLPQSFRHLFMGLQKPDDPEIIDDFFIDKNELTDEQVEIVKKAIVSSNYFLIWGPPGTGKTSIVLRELVRHYTRAKKKVLLLAYTNRAVDEICDSVCSIDSEIKNDFIRIGSKYSTNTKFHEHLLTEKVNKLNTRRELKTLLDSCDVYVSTISSIQGKKDIFSLKTFDVIIIDEASQLLEPMVLNVLPRAYKVIFIGDHKQLPAVVQQNGGGLKNKFDLLKEKLLLNSLDLSLFERLYKICQKNNWMHQFANLSYQGRMHERIMAFPSKMFYNGQLKVLEGIQRLTTQVDDESAYNFEQLIKSKRVVFIDTQLDSELTHKTNKYEAKLVANLVELFDNNTPITDPNYLGIISPYRAHIALIHKNLEKVKLHKKVTIDTVERYQGSARSYIIYSMCVNASTLLFNKVKQDGDVDRKFNVALTRAKEGIILLGNKGVLETHELYKSWIGQAFELSKENIDKYIK